jgi:hypothetical protein
MDAKNVILSGRFYGQDRGLNVFCLLLPGPGTTTRHFSAGPPVSIDRFGAGP